MGLTFYYLNVPGENDVMEAALVETSRPQPHSRKGTKTRTFRSQKVADYSSLDERNRSLGLKVNSWL